MVHLSVCFQTKYSLIVLVTTLVVITTEVWCLTPRCFPKAHHPYTDEGRNEGFETFKWYTPGTLSNFYLGHNRVYSTYFEFQGSCTIKAIAISFTAHGNCRFSVSSKSFDHNGWSNERSVRFSNLSTFGSRHNIYLSEQSSHGLLIKFTVRSDRTRPLSQCTFQLNEAREPFIALHVQEDYDECSALHNPCYGYYPNPDSGPHCHNTWGSYRCTCQHGYKLTQDGNTYTCNDIDECAQSDNHCYTYFRRDNAPNCINTPGTYNCVCPQGYEVEGIRNETLFQCRDIDECSLTPHHCVAYSAQGPRRCVNSMGSYTCNCVEGFIFQDTRNGSICVLVAITPATSSHPHDTVTWSLSRNSDSISISVQSIMGPTTVLQSTMPMTSAAQPQASYTLYVIIGSVLAVSLFFAALVIIMVVRRRKKNSAPPENSTRTVCVRRDPSNTTDLTENELYILQSIPENDNISLTFTGNSNDGPLPVIPITPVRALTTINPVYEESTCLQSRGSTKTVSTQEDASDYMEIP
eukprot:scpid40216/ scgid1641/ Signal peptide, CUB and EGF-like domain-containing protein 2; Protein You